MGTKCKGIYKIISTTQLTKQDKEGKQQRKEVFINIRIRNKNKKVLPIDYSSSTRAERKAKRLTP